MRVRSTTLILESVRSPQLSYHPNRQTAVAPHRKPVRVRALGREREPVQGELQSLLSRCLHHQYLPGREREREPEREPG